MLGKEAASISVAVIAKRLSVAVGGMVGLPLRRSVARGSCADCSGCSIISGSLGILKINY
jgi:hypothetical protein